MQSLIRHTLYHNHFCSDMQGNQTLQKNIQSLQNYTWYWFKLPSKSFQCAYRHWCLQQ